MLGCVLIMRFGDLRRASRSGHVCGLWEVLGQNHLKPMVSSYWSFHGPRMLVVCLLSLSKKSRDARKEASPDFGFLGAVDVLTGVADHKMVK